MHIDICWKKRYAYRMVGVYWEKRSSIYKRAGQGGGREKVTPPSLSLSQVNIHTRDACRTQIYLI